MKNITVAWLSALDSLKEVPDDQLQWFIDQATVVELSAGSIFFRPGDPMPGPFVILSGKLMLSVPTGNELQEAGVSEAGSIGGYLPFSRGKVSIVVTEAVEDLTVLQFPLGHLDEMIRSKFALTQALVHVMANRIKDSTAFLQQNEKMMALGKLSAGLAHELNNPAAAVVSGSASLGKHLKFVPDIFRQIMSLRLSLPDVDYLTNKLSSALSTKQMPVLTLMERSALEDEIFDWLEEHDVVCAAETAENLVDYGFSLTDLQDIKDHVSSQALPAVFAWINNNLVTEKIVEDIQEASSRIASLVGSVKTFTHMDQGHGKRSADIHDGIRNTLNMLQHKIRKGQIQVVENFNTSLPEVKVMIGEMNQVWTNLLDNAIDAMEANGQGQLTISTARVKNCLSVTITDNGVGIPDEIKSRIFDPFFTTKSVGKGTGLGLDVVMRIIKQHQGAVKVQSRPGKTEFVVEIPIQEY